MRITLVLALATTLAVFGCGKQPDVVADQARWTTALEAAMKPIAERPEVRDVDEVKYSMQGPFSASTAWITGRIWSTTDDPATNKALLEDAGRAVVEALADNPVKDSWVKIQVVTTSNDPVTWNDLGLGAAPTLDDVAAHLGIPR